MEILEIIGHIIIVIIVVAIATALEFGEHNENYR